MDITFYTGYGTPNDQVVLFQIPYLAFSENEATAYAELLAGQTANILCSPVTYTVQPYGLDAPLIVKHITPSKRFPFPTTGKRYMDVAGDDSDRDAADHAYIVHVDGYDGGTLVFGEEHEVLDICIDWRVEHRQNAWILNPEEVEELIQDGLEETIEYVGNNGHPMVLDDLIIRKVY